MWKCINHPFARLKLFSSHSHSDQQKAPNLMKIMLRFLCLWFLFTLARISHYNVWSYSHSSHHYITLTFVMIVAANYTMHCIFILIRGLAGVWIEAWQLQFPCQASKEQILKLLFVNHRWLRAGGASNHFENAE